ncbi:MAG: OmpA family protein [Byssovorax sp.]
MRAPLVRFTVLLLAAAGCSPAPAPALSPSPRPALSSSEQTSVVRATGGQFDPTDRDGDGVGDAYDLCPTLLEDQRGEHPLDGCPEDRDPNRLATRWGRSPSQSVTVAHDQIRTGEEIRFARSSAAIEPSSQPLVASIAQVLKDAPEIEVLEIAGHADDSGSEAANNRLTVQRASSVMLAMIERGVSRDRLRAAGYGAYCPVVGARREGSAEAGDRRVEFRILRRDRIDLEPRWGGCEAAAKHGMKPMALQGRKSAARAGAASDDDECAEATPKACKALCEARETDACMIFAAAVRDEAAPDPASGRPDAVAALGALTRACELGRSEACALAARAIREGRGAPKDPKKALDLDATACAKGGALACADLGLALHVAVGKARDEARSIEAYRRACDLDEEGGCEALGAAYWSGSGVPGDHARAFDLFAAACEIGHRGCAALRDHVKDDPSAQRSRARALVALHVACEQDGDADACGAITIMGEKPGEYSPAPVCSAGTYAACTAACGAAPAGEACLGLADALLYGMGARRKPVDARTIFERACRADSARGCAMSALLRESSATGSRDLRVAFDEYDLACTAGDAAGCVHRARLRLEGLGTYRDEVVATKALDAACTKGVGIACAHLALAAAKGLGAPADPGRARALSEQACAAGFRPSCSSSPAAQLPR